MLTNGVTRTPYSKTGKHGMIVVRDVEINGLISEAQYRLPEVVINIGLIKVK
jgi:hypothetical protein